MIELHELTKRYGNILAVDHVNLSIGVGEVFGFLGPNGAGKTTTIRMMMGLLQPTEGRVELNGHDLSREPLLAKQLTGFVPDRPHIYEKLTANEFLAFVAGLYRVPDALMTQRRNELLELFDLGNWADELVESYSHGMKQRLTMAAALIHGPRILIVDEPMVGLDPRGARLLKRTFRELAAGGVTIFMSTHSLEVAEETCDRIGIIDGGRIIALGTVEELRRQIGSEDPVRLESVFLTLTGGEDGVGRIGGMRA
ncbi:MAG TPA: ABC transporter ATP-binding protein [Candidatus Binatia bacterium]|nr:ABC transporter ATP-binding protein [Candidatus Binatia bacterium]